MWQALALAAAIALSQAPEVAANEMDTHVGQVTGQPIPRYVSIKARRANARRGPGTDHRIDWVFQRSGLPVRVTAEWEHWRRVEDSDGEGGWIHYALLSGIRTAIVGDEMVSMRYDPVMASQARAKLEPGVIGALKECERYWCRIEVDDIDGWVRKDWIWGVDPEEEFD